MKRITLNSNWFFKGTSGKNKWLKAKVPGNIHLDLLDNKIIPDPYYRLNETEQQWIGETDWEYKTSFEINPGYLKNEHIDIVFEGLDTYADIYINDSPVLNTDNMYCGWRVNIKPFLKKGANELRIYFHSVIKKTLPLFQNNGFEYGANNSQPEPKLSVYTRKPGYHYGWDWGPRLLTCGIWRPVCLEAWNAVRLDNIRFVQRTLSDELAELQLEAEIISAADETIELRLAVNRDTYKVTGRMADLKEGLNTVRIDFSIADPEKWWCRGLGNQHLYELSLEMFHEGNLTDIWNEKVGLRNIELVHEDDDHGKCFYFRINGRQVFIKGSNCLPVDYFIPRVQEKDYIRLLKDAAATNMNMLRLWGGAIYEEDIFYKLCDEMGILVWQDFMFACAMYPADDVMQKRIRCEAEYNIKRLRNHPSLALWCGNNEIDEGWHHWGWQELYNYSSETCEKIRNYYLTIFHNILPQAVRKFDPGRAYRPSSPKYGFTDTKSRSDGDMHYWGVWFLNHPKERFKDYLPRFMSEYGLQSMPELKTFEAFTLPEDRNLKSHVMLAHQRQYPNLKKGQTLGGYDIMLKYIEDEFCVPDDFELLAYTSQLLQAEYLRYAIEAHRRNMPYCMGTMYWQLNDLWPVTSWSTIDYYGRWKAANYMVKKAYAPVLVSTDDQENGIKIFIINDLQNTENMQLKMKLLAFNGNILYEKQMPVMVEANSSKLVYEISKDELHVKNNINKIVWAAALHKNNNTVAESLFYFVNTNNLQLQEPEISHSIIKVKDEYIIELHCNTLAKYVKLITQNADGHFSDNYFDLLPGEKKAVVFKPESKWDGELRIIHYYDIHKNCGS